MRGEKRSQEVGPGQVSSNKQQAAERSGSGTKLCPACVYYVAAAERSGRINQEKSLERQAKMTETRDERDLPLLGCLGHTKVAATLQSQVCQRRNHTLSGWGSLSWLECGPAWPPLAAVVCSLQRPNACVDQSATAWPIRDPVFPTGGECRLHLVWDLFCLGGGG